MTSTKGVHFHVGASDESKDLTYIHWSVFGGYANFRRPEQMQLEPWIIPYYHSSSCGVRSGVVCYQLSHKFTFPTSHDEWEHYQRENLEFAL
ncbi:uncharacterized protein B0T15DRAFT_531552 [Chaetomium strumarium]|uniref:Uncharacterized protein n=1 Tax=Chaetomium strumarium TaxID=1170767 RepID=A0AAJ0GS95_9PEZI|nr:hypothetical protein B0T15DRAFT_531552 [Chaetomium strumarium]